MAFDVAWTPSAKRSLTRLPDKVGHAVVEFVYGPLADNPHRVGKALRLELAGLHTARRGDFRIIYRIDDDARRVAVLAIEHRADVYRSR